MKARTLGAIFIAGFIAISLLGTVGAAPVYHWHRVPRAVHGPFPLERPLYVPPDLDVVQTQVIPEGCHGYGFETFITLVNAGNQRALFSLVIHGREQYYVTAPCELLPHQRRTIDMSLMLPAMPDFEGYDMAFTLLFDSPHAYAQVSMYWNNREAGHTSAGIVR